MWKKRWGALIALLGGAGLLGAGAIVATVEVNRATSTDAFCVSCHSMGHVAADSVFKRSAHRANAAGIVAGCSDCHIPRTNLAVETYTHVASGIRDVLAESINDFKSPEAWEKRRTALAHYVRDTMRANDSVTCRGCHQTAAIRPESEPGRAAHGLLAERRATCIDCHINLVHAPVPPSEDFLRRSGLRTPRK